MRNYGGLLTFAGLVILVMGALLGVSAGEPKPNAEEPIELIATKGVPYAVALETALPEDRFWIDPQRRPLTWTLDQSAALPPGFKLSEEGFLTGTPLEAQEHPYSFTVEFKDSWKGRGAEGPIKVTFELYVGLPPIRRRSSPGQRGSETTKARSPGKAVAEVGSTSPPLGTTPRVAAPDANPPTEEEPELSSPSRAVPASSNDVEGAAAPPAASTPPATPSVVTLKTPLRHGDYIISGKAPANITGVQVEVDGKGVAVETQRIEKGDYWIKLSVGLIKGQRVEVIATDGTSTFESNEAKVEPGLVDDRDPIETSFYVGTAVDTFASEDVNKLINADVSGDIKGRGVAGFDFAARLFGQPKEEDGRNYSWFTDSQLWIYGETVHGTRSSEIDCNANMDFPSCRDTFDPTVPQKSLLLLRNATSLEGFAGLRLEFASLQRNWVPMNLYAKGQVGFLTVADGPDDAEGIHHGGLGVIVTKGPLIGSYLEAGFGTTELFTTRPKDRWKFDGLLSYEINPTVAFFAQMTADVDFGGGADSFQSYFGFDFDLRELFKTVKGEQ